MGTQEVCHVSITWIDENWSRFSSLGREVDPRRNLGGHTGGDRRFASNGTGSSVVYSMVAGPLN